MSKDFEQKEVVSIADIQEQTRLYFERCTRNKVELAGVVRGSYKTEPKPRFKRDENGKNTTEQDTDEFGELKFWDSRYYIKLAFEGGDTDISVTKDNYEKLVIGQRVLFEGVKAVKFGTLQDVFSTVTIL